MDCWLGRFTFESIRVAHEDGGRFGLVHAERGAHHHRDQTGLRRSTATFISVRSLKPRFS